MKQINQMNSKQPHLVSKGKNSVHREKEREGERKERKDQDKNVPAAQTNEGWDYTVAGSYTVSFHMRNPMAPQSMNLLELGCRYQTKPFSHHYRLLSQLKPQVLWSFIPATMPPFKSVRRETSQPYKNPL